MELVAPSKCLGGGEIDYQLEFGRLLHRDIAGFILLLHRRGQHLALSWLYLPCALKAAIAGVSGYRATPASLPRLRGRSKALGLGPGDHHSPNTRGTIAV